MVNKIAHSPNHEGTSGTSDYEVIAEMWTAMELLWRHNRMLEDDIQNIKQHQQEVNPLKETELLHL